MSIEKPILYAGANIDHVEKIDDPALLNLYKKRAGELIVRFFHMVIPGYRFATIIVCRSIIRRQLVPADFFIKGAANCYLIMIPNHALRWTDNALKKNRFNRVVGNFLWHLSNSFKDPQRFCKTRKYMGTISDGCLH